MLCIMVTSDNTKNINMEIIQGDIGRVLSESIWIQLFHRALLLKKILLNCIRCVFFPKKSFFLSFSIFFQKKNLKN